MGRFHALAQHLPNPPRVDKAGISSKFDAQAPGGRQSHQERQRNRHPNPTDPVPVQAGVGGIRKLLRKIARQPIRGREPTRHSPEVEQAHFTGNAERPCQPDDHQTPQEAAPSRRKVTAQNGTGYPDDDGQPGSLNRGCPQLSEKFGNRTRVHRRKRPFDLARTEPWQGHSSNILRNSRTCFGLNFLCSTKCATILFKEPPNTRSRNDELTAFTQSRSRTSGR